jgi:disulfide oxidoreductase YuzD
MFEQKRYESDNPARDALLGLGYVTTIIAIIFIIYKVKPSWIVTDHEAIREKYIRDTIEPLELRARIIKKYKKEYDRKYFDAFHLNDRGKAFDMFVSAIALDEPFYPLYYQAQIGDSVIKEKGTRIYILVHKGVRTKYIYY